ncbi:hypothetical protein RIR_jg36512.t1 [Rhizophagus irregularis DAOM 181602=DAOM 197198]|nr:hypothetical protein RIR_jg36512.t1 [Rhizophagus irregularis DAOM 181602=DAOM 197198]
MNWMKQELKQLTVDKSYSLTIFTALITIVNDILKSKKGKSMTYLMSTLMHTFFIPKHKHSTRITYNILMLCGWLILL